MKRWVVAVLAVVLVAIAVTAAVRWRYLGWAHGASRVQCQNVAETALDDTTVPEREGTMHSPASPWPFGALNSLGLGRKLPPWVVFLSLDPSTHGWKDFDARALAAMPAEVSREVRTAPPGGAHRRLRHERPA